MKTATLTQTAISVLFPRKQETSNYKYTFSQPRRIVKLRLDYSKRFFFYLKETALHIINIDLEDEKCYSFVRFKILFVARTFTHDSALRRHSRSAISSSGALSTIDLAGKFQTR